MSNKKYNIKAHPLTIISGCVFLLTSKPFNVACYLAVVLFHEFSHYAVAKRLGVPLEDVVITPFGGCLKGELLGITRGKTLLITLIPPLINIVVAGLIFAFWWLFPSLYPYTEAVAYANLSVGAINLLPCYPLDGGRAATAMIKNGDRFAKRLIKAFSVVAAFVSFGLFTASVALKQINLSYLLMGVFLLFGAFYEENKDYVEIGCKRVLKKKKRGIVPIKAYFVGDADDFELLSRLNEDTYHLFLRESVDGTLEVEDEESFLRRIKNK